MKFVNVGPLQPHLGDEKGSARPVSPRGMVVGIGRREGPSYIHRIGMILADFIIIE